MRWRRSDSPIDWGWVFFLTLVIVVGAAVFVTCAQWLAQPCPNGIAC